MFSSDTITILAQTSCTCLRIVQMPLEPVVLQRFSLGESVQISLDHTDVQALLRALPPTLLREALGEGSATGLGWCVCGHAYSLHHGGSLSCHSPFCDCALFDAATRSWRW